jgi:hypothetical protein
MEFDHLAAVPEKILNYLADKRGFKLPPKAAIASKP